MQAPSHEVDSDFNIIDFMFYALFWVKIKDGILHHCNTKMSFGYSEINLRLPYIL